MEVKYFSLSKQRQIENKAGRMLNFYTFSKTFKIGVLKLHLKFDSYICSLEYKTLTVFFLQLAITAA